MRKPIERQLTKTSFKIVSESLLPSRPEAVGRKIDLEKVVW